MRAVLALLLMIGSASAQTVTVSPTTATPGAAVTVTVVGGPGNARDWVAIAPAGSSASTFQSWAYLTTGTQSAPAAPPYKTGGSVTLTAPAVSGSYEVRFLLSDGFTIPPGARAPLSVSTSCPLGQFMISANPFKCALPPSAGPAAGMARGTPTVGASCTSPNKDDSFYDLTTGGSLEIFVCDPVANRFRQVSPSLPTTLR